MAGTSSKMLLASGVLVEKNMDADQQRKEL